MELLRYEDKLDVTTAFNSFHLSTSNDSNNATHQNSYDKEDDIDMNTVHLDDHELTLFFRYTSEDYGDEVFAVIKKLLM